MYLQITNLDLCCLDNVGNAEQKLLKLKIEWAKQNLEKIVKGVENFIVDRAQKAKQLKKYKRGYPKDIPFLFQ